MKLEKSRSIVSSTSTSSHETAIQLVWRAIAKMYSLMSLGLEEVSPEEAKGYTKVLLILVSAIVIGGMVEGGAI